MQHRENQNHKNQKKNKEKEKKEKEKLKMKNAESEIKYGTMHEVLRFTTWHAAMALCPSLIRASLTKHGRILH